MNDINIIGAGGIGQWLAPAMLHSFPNDMITVWDGDSWEPKNQLRSHITDDEMSQNKAITTARRSHDQLKAVPEYFIAGKYRPSGLLPVFISCADNHRARMECLIAADANKGVAFIACNEEWSSQALIYLPGWIATQLDPRMRYPDIMDVTDNDPIAAAAGCGHIINAGAVQTVSANMAAASAVLHLCNLWLSDVKDTTKYLYYPIELIRSKTGVEAIYTADHIKPHETQIVVPQALAQEAPPESTTSAATEETVTA